MRLYYFTYFIALLAVLIMYSCDHKPDQIDIDAVKATAVKSPDKDGAIYEFMMMVIDDQKLNRKQRLEPIAKHEIGMTNSSGVFDMLLIDTVRQKSFEGNDDRKNLHVEVSFEPPKCLTLADMTFMQRQQKERTGFMWDNSRMGFTINKTDHWYVLSIPLFSNDSTKALITIRDLCKGLCGTGQTLLYQKMENKWSSVVTEMWYH